METLVESPRVAFVSGTKLPASSSFSLYRLILPFLCIAIGVSVGSAAGLTLALVNASNDAVAASSDSAEVSAAPEANLAANASSAQATQAAASPSPTEASSTVAANTTASPAIGARAVKLSPPAVSVARPAAPPSKIEVALNKTPDALKPATFKLEGKTYHVAKMMFVPPAEPAQNEEAAAPPTAPTALNSAQWSLDTPAPASLYTEGDLTVSDYNASTKTLQTSDGKSFVLGTTVAAGNAASWDTYRSDLHYRCDQNGSCVLMRAGVVAPDARLI